MCACTARNIQVCLSVCPSVLAKPQKQQVEQWQNFAKRLSTRGIHHFLCPKTPKAWYGQIFPTTIPAQGHELFMFCETSLQEIGRVMIPSASSQYTSHFSFDIVARLWEWRVRVQYQYVNPSQRQAYVMVPTSSEHKQKHSSSGRAGIWVCHIQ